MSYFCDDVDAALGGYHTSAYTGLGLRGDQVPASGADGPSVLYPCLSLPADAATEVFMQLTRLPTLGVLTIEEDGSFVYTGATDYLEFRLWAGGIAFTADIGFGPGIVRVSLNVGNSGFAGGGQLAGVLAGGSLTLSGGTPPTFSQQPANASRTAGQQAQFLAVVQGTAPLTVQWKKNGTVVASTVYPTAPATAIYTTPVLTLSDNGSSFVAEASNAIATNVASASAALSVVSAPSPSPSPSPGPSPGPNPGGGKHVSNSILDGLSLDFLTARLTQMQLAYLDLSSGAKPQVVSYSQADGSKSVSYTQADLGRLAQAIKAVQAQIDALNGVTSNRRRPMRPLF